MINAATDHALTGRDRGWRKAVRFVLTENPVGEEPTRRSEGFFALINETPPDV